MATMEKKVKTSRTVSVDIKMEIEMIRSVIFLCATTKETDHIEKSLYLCINTIDELLESSGNILEQICYKKTVEGSQ